jgi:DNA polymerase III subunit alpha
MPFTDPGPMEYIPSFIERKHGREPITYDLPEMEGYLKETYGITVYQEQVMLLSQKLANFTKGEADMLRKAMGKKILSLLEKMKPMFLDRGEQNGHPRKVLEKIWKDWEAFASYAFNKSHSTCYAWIAYQTAYLKSNYPAEYMAAVLTNNMNDITKVTFFMEECKRMQIPVLSPDVNESAYNFTVNKNGEIRFGLGAIKGVGGGAVESIVMERKENGAYASIFDFVTRVDLRNVNKKCFENLILAGAFDSFEEYHRAQYFHEENGKTFLEQVIKYGNSIKLERASAQQSLFGEDSSEVEMPVPNAPVCPKWPSTTKLAREKEVVGIFISGHPLEDYRFEIDNFCNIELSQLSGNLAALYNKELTFCAIVSNFTTRQTKNGKNFGILEMEDFSGAYKQFLFGDSYDKFLNLMTVGNRVLLKGKVQRKPYAKTDDDIELNILSIMHLADSIKNLANELVLYLDINEINHTTIDYLKGVLLDGKENENNSSEEPTEEIVKLKLRFVVKDYLKKMKLDMPSKHRVIFNSEFTKKLDTLKKHNIKFSIGQKK